MKLYSIKVGKKELFVKPISSPEDMKQGLSGAPRLGANKGLFFILSGTIDVTMNMGGMKHPIDMLFIGEDMTVKQVSSMEVDSPDIRVKAIRYVLEVRKGVGEGLLGAAVDFGEYADKFTASETAKNIIVQADRFRDGGVVVFKEDKVRAKSGNMQVLDHDGVVLMNIAGGERIFSIKHTEKLIRLAEKVEAGEAEKEELGLLMKDIVHRQDTQKKEYV